MNLNLRIAVCQFPVSHSIDRNSKHIRKFMKKAAEAEAHVVHFPETALSGYGRIDFTSANTENWQILEEQMEKIIHVAKELGLWVILGSCRKIANEEKPANCVRIISSEGTVIGTYDKQKLTPSELDFYTPGNGFLTVTINGIKCGILICYELRFPELFEIYSKIDVRLIFHSAHNVSRKPQPLLEKLTLAQIRTRAVDNQIWISSSNSSARNSFSTACVACPDGSINSLRKHISGILRHDFPYT